MAFTKLSFYLGMLFIVIVGTMGLLTWGNDLQTSNVSLDNESESYIDDFGSYLVTQGVTDLANEDISELKTNNYLGEDNTTGSSAVNDFLANTNYNIGRVNEVVNYVKFIFNIPTLILRTFKLPVGEFNYVVNTLGIIIFIGTLMFIFMKARS